MKENASEMSIMTTMTTILHRHGSGRRRATLLGTVLTMACVALLLVAAAAFAAPEWKVTSEHGPQDFAPGGQGQYMLHVFNVGDAITTSAATLTDTLPSGVTATAAGGGPYWDCSGTTFPATTTVTCTYNFPQPASGTDAGQRGAVAQPLAINVNVDPGASGTHGNVVEVSGGGAASAASTTDPTTFSATPTGFGFLSSSIVGDVFDGSFPSGAPARQAGSHPYEARIDFALNNALGFDPNESTPASQIPGASPPTPFIEPADHIKTLVTKLPAGLIGDPYATPRCPATLVGAGGTGDHGACPPNTQVGTIDLVMQNGKATWSANATTDVPVFNMVPPPGSVAALGLSVLGVPVWITVSLDPADHYAVVATMSYATELVWVRSAQLTLWGVPGDPAHDALRLDTGAPDPSTAMGTPFTGAPIKPYLTLPSICGVPGAIRLRAESWEHAGAFTPWQAGAAATMTGCDDPRFRFNPTIAVQPESHSASTPTGVDVELTVPQKDGALTDAADLYPPSGKDIAIATPPLLNAKVVLPEGLNVSPSSADGLGACTPRQIGLGENSDPTCPDASKIGTVKIYTPLLPDPLTGTVYLATQNDNPFGSLLAIYVVAQGQGVTIKLPGKVTPDPVTGQLTTTFDGNPPIPFSKLQLHFNSGPRAPLTTPPTCGTRTTSADLSSWNMQLPAAHLTDAFTIDSGCAKGFAPHFTGGTKNPSAGKDSPLVTRFTRTDGDQELSRLRVSLPPGLLGHIADVVLCADADAAAGTCPAGARIGTATVGAGPGSNPFYISDGRVYMTGPYKGAPFGLSIVVHAKAGPLDLGDVVVRAAVFVDRRTAALAVASDPLPTILRGIPLDLRDVRVDIDRPGFTLNPTNCKVMAMGSTITSLSGFTATPGVRFQVGDCGALKFKPRVRLRLKGATGRTGHPALKAVVTYPQAGPNANIARAQVNLPHSEFLDQGNLNKTCTRPVLLAGACPASTIYGRARAFTPLLDRPLEGPVYLVGGYGYKLPAMVAELNGQIRVLLVGKVDTGKNKGIRSTFEVVPDAPVSRFVLEMKGGKKYGLLENSEDLCSKRTKRTAIARFTGQNGKVDQYRPKVAASCKKKARKTRQRRGHARQQKQAHSGAGKAKQHNG